MKNSTVVLDPKIHAILKTISLDRKVNIKDFLGLLTQKDIAQGEKMKEFEEQYGHEKVNGIFMDDESGVLDAESIGKSMIKSWIFQAAAYLNINPADIKIKEVSIDD